MPHTFFLRVLLGAALVLIVDLLLYFGLRRVFVKPGLNPARRRRFTYIYFGITLAFALYALLHFLYIHFFLHASIAYRQYFIITGVFLLMYAPKVIALLFIGTGNIILFILQFFSYVMQRPGHYEFVRRIRRIKFLSWLGVLVGVIYFGLILYGMAFTRTDYKIKEVTLSYDALPPAFDGMTIMVLADLHTGSFYGPRELSAAFTLMNEQQPDMLIMAGDMINVSADEVYPYIQDFASMQPPLGKFAVLGNHDQDDYMKMTDAPDRANTEAALTRAYRAMGFTLLRNQHEVVRKGKDSITLIGVDSWGKPPFRQYGNLPQASAGLSMEGFEILLSHIPEHWSAEVENQRNIELTLAGHTHAMQAAINLPWFKWSPIQYKYPHYMGLYGKDNQWLYVNPGLGYLGFAGRVCIRPEITMITLRRK